MPKYFLNGKEITKEQALKELNDRPIRTEGTLRNGNLYLITLKVEEDKTNYFDRKFGA